MELSTLEVVRKQKIDRLIELNPAYKRADLELKDLKALNLLLGQTVNDLMKQEKELKNE